MIRGRGMSQNCNYHGQFIHIFRQTDNIPIVKPGYHSQNVRTFLSWIMLNFLSRIKKLHKATCRDGRNSFLVSLAIYHNNVQLIPGLILLLAIQPLCCSRHRFQ